MPTPSSGSEAYALVADLIYRCDLRSLQDLASDTDIPIAEEDLDDNDNLLRALRGASGEVEAAVLAARTYKVADLQALTGNSLEYLKDIVSGLAIERLFRRRPDREGKVPEAVKLAREDLDRLRAGEWVLGLLEQQEAGLIDTHTETPGEVEARRGIVFTASRYFGTRVNRMGGGG